MKILSSLLVILLSSSAFAARYIVLFQGSQARSFSQIEKFSQLPVKVEQRLPNLNAMIVESEDESLENLSNSDVRIEKEVVHHLPNYIVEKDPVHLAFLSDAPVNWGVDAVHAPAAWAAGFKGNGARVLTLDSGADITHPALKSQIEKTKNFMKNEGTAVKDNIGHGTHVAGTVLSVAPEAQLLIGKICGDDGECTSSDMIKGIEWGLAEKVDVINLSLGDPNTTPAEKEVVLKAEKLGVLLVAATGNDGEKAVAYPAAYPTAVAVGAINQALDVADFSNWGPELDLVAPGNKIVSSTPVDSGKPYSTFSGTSMAAPHVSGVAALLRGANKALKPAQVQEILKKTATSMGAPSFHYGAGLVNAEKAVTKALELR